MNPQTVWEIIGYAASLLVLVSFLMASVVKLRIINMIGSFIFAVYALAIGSYPTAVMNFCLVLINVYYLIRVFKTSKLYSLLPAKLDDPFFCYFLRFYGEDIRTYFPDFDLRQSDADTACFVCCDAVPVGLLVGRDLGDGTFEVALDYSTPQYRDCSVGRYLYRQLSDQGCKKLIFRANAEKHAAYLKKMGFVLGEDGYVKTL